VSALPICIRQLTGKEAMKRSRSHRYIPSLLVAVAASIPIATGVEMMTHMAPTPAGAPLPSTPAPAAAPSTQPAGTTNSSLASASTTPSHSTTRFAIKGGGGDDGGSDDGAGRVVKPAQLYSSTAPASSKTTTSPTAGATKTTSKVSGTFSGPSVSDPFGAVQTTVTVAQGKITTVSITAPMANPVSANINSQAVPYLRSETLTAQSASINSISGATLTSQAYVQSLQGAMKSAGLA
jgi:uncharacterized protein with FMN-binding domain